MNGTTQSTRAGAEFAQAVKSLAEKEQIPLQEVEQIFLKEFSRLASGARIPTFTSLLAIRRTRDILRESRRRSDRR